MISHNKFEDITNIMQCMSYIYICLLVMNYTITVGKSDIYYVGFLIIGIERERRSRWSLEKCCWPQTKQVGPHHRKECGGPKQWRPHIAIGLCWMTRRQRMRSC